MFHAKYLKGEFNILGAVIYFMIDLAFVMKLDLLIGKRLSLRPFSPPCCVPGLALGFLRLDGYTASLNIARVFSGFLRVRSLVFVLNSSWGYYLNGSSFLELPLFTDLCWAFCSPLLWFGGCISCCKFICCSQMWHFRTGLEAAADGPSSDAGLMPFRSDV